MKLAIITVTKKGVEKALKIKEKISCDIFTMEKFLCENTIPIKNNLRKLFEKEIENYNVFLFITATGIAVRTIAPFIKSKDKDPAVLSMDEEGNFIISLLSGHLGGANESAIFLGKVTGAFPVISTASDVSGKIAVDTIAMKINSKIESLEKAKKVTSLIVSGKNVDIKIPENINSENPEGLIVVSNRKNIEMVKLIPQNLIIGIGCKKDKSETEIINFIKDIFEDLNLCLEGIKCFSTVDIKKDEVGIIKTAEYFGKELLIISRDEIKKVEDRFIKSEFVKKEIGVGAVSAPCAFLASCKKGRFLVEKIINNGITISIFEEETKVNE